MIRVDIIQEKLFGLVGLSQPLNPSFPVLESDLLISRSGYKPDDHSNVDLQLFKSTQEYKDISDSDLNELLRRLQKVSIVNVVNSVFNDSSYLDKNVLYRYSQNLTNTDELPNGFIYHKIKVSDEKNIAFKITRTFLNFEGSGDVELLLFNTNSIEPLFRKTVSISSKSQVEDLNWIIDNSGDTYKGEYYFGYLTNGLTVQPYRRDYELSDITSNLTYLNVYEKGVIVDHDTSTLFDLEKEDSTSVSTGLNPDITVYEDFTELVVQNEMLFAKAIELDMQIQFMQYALNTLRSNGKTVQAESKMLRIVQELQGARESDTGIRDVYLTEINKIDKEIDRIKKGYFTDGLTVVTLD